MNTRISCLRVSTCLLIAGGIWLVSLGPYSIFSRPPLLPEDTRFMGNSLAQVWAAVPGLEGWLKRGFVVMGGFMPGTGVLTVFAACVAMPRRWKGRSWAIAMSGVLTVALMCAINFDIHPHFRWLLLVPALVWLAGYVLYIARR